MSSNAFTSIDIGHGAAQAIRDNSSTDVYFWVTIHVRQGVGFATSDDDIDDAVLDVVSKRVFTDASGSLAGVSA